jgi:hypothetical protein
MHDEIIRFSVNGTLPDANIVQTKERMVRFLLGAMKDNGCTPVLEMDPQFTLDYKAEHEHFEFALSMYGVWVGSEEAWEASGMTNGTMILNYTQKPKSKES